MAEWSSHLTFEHLYAMPWAISLRLGDDNSQAQHLHVFRYFMIESDTTLFVCQNCH